MLMNCSNKKLKLIKYFFICLKLLQKFLLNIPTKSKIHFKTVNLKNL